MRIDLESMTDEQYESYREECDSRGAAEFRYRRETCGIELVEMADDLGVRVDTAKRWENPKKGMPPSLRAWAYVDSAYLGLLDAVEAVIQQAEKAAESPDGPEAVHLPYRRGIQTTRGGVTVARANAISRAAGIALTALGYDVVVEWADDGDARAPRG